MASAKFQERFKDKISTVSKFGDLNIHTDRSVNKPPLNSATRTTIQISANSIIQSNAHIIRTQTNFNNEEQIFARPIKLKSQPDPSIPGGMRRVSSDYDTEIQDKYTTFGQMPPRTLPTQSISAQIHQLHSELPPELLQDYTPKGSPFIPNRLSAPDMKYDKRPGRPPIHRRGQTKSAAPIREQQIVDNSQEIRQMRMPRMVEFSPYTLKDYKNIQSDKYYQLGGLGAFNIGTEEWNRKKRLQDRRADYGKHVKLSHQQLMPMTKKENNDHEVIQESSARQRALDFAKNIPKPKAKREVQNEPQNKTPPAPINKLDRLQEEHNKYRMDIESIRSQFQQ